ncbi:MAG TPA: MscL family protein [Candidatus Saccharimonadales bacterium]
MAEKSDQKEATVTVNTGDTIRIGSSNSHHRRPKHLLIDPQEIHPVNGFLDFLREHSVVSLAIAFVIGLQSQTLVKQLVTSFIDPLFSLLFGRSLSQRTFTLDWHGRAVNFTWGAFAYALLDFIFVLAAVYAIVKILSLEDLDKPRRKAKKVDLSSKKSNVDDVQDIG